MSDNVAITAGSGTTIATDDIGSGVQVQRVKPVWGADGTGNDTQVANPLPVQTTAEVSQMSSLGTIVTPQFASISVSSSGNNSIVAAVTSKSIVVLAYTLVADGTVAVKWQSDTASPTDLSGAMSLVANGGASANCQQGLLKTASGKALCLNLSVAVGVRGHLTYIAV